MKGDTVTLAAEVFAEHGYASWRFVVVDYRGNGTPPIIARTFREARAVSFSSWLDEQEPWLRREFVLHELAHVMVEDNGVYAHGPAWRACARRIGCIYADAWPSR